MKTSVGLAVLLAGLALLGGAGAAAPSPLGLILFTSTRDGSESLYAIRPDGTHMTRLVANANDARIAPDGSHAIFTATGAFRAFALDLANGRRRALPADAGWGWNFTPRPWSADGRQFALGAESGIRVFAADGSGAHRVSDGQDSGPAWSPDGTQIAFGRFAGGLYVVGADGSGPRLLTKNGDTPQWSPDGREIAFTRDTTTYVMAAGGGAPRRIAGGYAAWSPDSTTLAVADEDTGLALYTRAGTLVRRLLEGKGAEWPSWSPDGRSVLTSFEGDLWVFARDGSSKTRLTEGARYGYVNSAPTWSERTPGTLAGTPVVPAIAFGGPLAAISRTTGRLVAFPRVSGSGYANSRSVVQAVVDDGKGGWYVGGDFVAIGDVRCRNLAHVTAARTVDARFCPRPNGPVSALERIGTTLFVAGVMVTQIDDKPRHGLAAFDTVTGRLRSWNPVVRGDVYELASDPSHRTLYFSGSFDRVGGRARLNFAAVDVASGRPTGFAPNPPADFHGDCVAAFAVAARHVYSWGYYARIGGKRVLGATAQLDPLSGKLESWQPVIAGGPYTTAVVGSRVVLGGWLTRLAGVRRDDLLSFDGASGRPDAWSPTTGKEHVEQVVTDGPTLIAALAVDHWSPGARRLAAYSLANGGRLWSVRVALNGSVNTLAASRAIVVVGGSFTKAA